MATITLKNVPAELYDKLKKAAAVNRRSVNSEVIVCIESALGSRPVDTEKLVEKARKVRRLTIGAPISDAELRRAKEEGRL